jgi:hypothetical protein
MAKDAETWTERACDYGLMAGFCFLGVLTIFLWCYSTRRGDVPRVKKLFWALILLNSIIRSVWFGIPEQTWCSQYGPQYHQVITCSSGNPKLLQFIELSMRVVADLCWFAAFILIVFFWASLVHVFFRSHNNEVHHQFEHSFMHAGYRLRRTCSPWLTIGVPRSPSSPPWSHRPLAWCS